MICIGLIDFEMNRGRVMLNIPSTKFGIAYLLGSKGTNIFGNDFFHQIHLLHDV
jgi:hypothetical protein